MKIHVLICFALLTGRMLMTLTRSMLPLYSDPAVRRTAAHALTHKHTRAHAWTRRITGIRQAVYGMKHAKF